MIWIWILINVCFVSSVYSGYLPLYERCSKLQYAQTCVENGDVNFPGCSAQKNYTVFRGFTCSSDCPPPLDIMHISSFQRQQDYDKQDELSTGVNVSWSTVPKGGGSQHQMQHYRLSIERISTDKWMVVLVSVNTSKLKTDQLGKMWFHFDCFFPLEKNGTRWKLMIRRIPYNRSSSQNEIERQFQLDENGDIVLPNEVKTGSTTTGSTTTTSGSTTTTTGSTTITTESTTTTTVPTTESIATGHTTTTTATPTETRESTKTNKISSISVVIPEETKASYKDDGNGWQSNFGVYLGLLVGLLVVITGVAVVTTCYIYHHKKHSHADDVKVLRNLVLVYDNKNSEHTERVNHLASSLTHIATVIDFWEIKVNNAPNLQDKLIEKFKIVDTIIIVSSDTIVDALRGLENGWSPMENPITMMLDVFNMNKEYKAKVVTVYFPEEKHYKILKGLSQWCPVVVPAKLELLFKFISDPQSESLVPIDYQDKLICRLSDLESMLDLNLMDDGKSFHRSVSLDGLPSTEIGDSGFDDNCKNKTDHEQCQKNIVKISPPTEHVGFFCEHHLESGKFHSQMKIINKQTNTNLNEEPIHVHRGNNSQVPQTDIHFLKDDALGYHTKCFHTALPRTPGSAPKGYFIRPRRCNSFNTDVSSEIANLNME